MSPQQRPPAGDDASDEGYRGDPWHAFGYLVAGVLLYGGLGWLVDRWLGTSFVVAIGILLGAGLGMYMTFARFNRPRPGNGSEESTGPGARHQGGPQDKS